MTLQDQVKKVTVTDHLYERASQEGVSHMGHLTAMKEPVNQTFTFQHYYNSVHK